MKRELRRIEPWSGVRVGFFFGLLTGFLFGLFNGVAFKYFAGILGSEAIPKDMLNLVNLSGGAIFALAIVTSLICSLAAAVSGGIGAVLYNLIASLFGGLEISVTGDEPTARASTSTPEEDQDESL